MEMVLYVFTVNWMNYFRFVLSVCLLTSTLFPTTKICCKVFMFPFYFLQGYEARLFRLNKAHGGMITSAEEAVDLQKKISALNRFYRTCSQSNKNSTPSNVGNKENMRKRDVGEKLVVSCFVSSASVHCQRCFRFIHAPLSVQLNLGYLFYY